MMKIVVHYDVIFNDSDFQLDSPTVDRDEGITVSHDKRDGTSKDIRRSGTAS